MRGFFGKVLILGSLVFGVVACRIRITPLSPPAEPVCQPPPIEKNIIGTWRFESNHFPAETVRTGSVTFIAQKGIIDPDSLFENNVNGTGSSLLKVVEKIYDTDGIIQSNLTGYTGKIFRVDLLARSGSNRVIWPFYVASNECNKIVIYRLSTYEQPVSRKLGFTLTR